MNRFVESFAKIRKYGIDLKTFYDGVFSKRCKFNLLDSTVTNYSTVISIGIERNTGIRVQKSDSVPIDKIVNSAIFITVPFCTLHYTERLGLGVIDYPLHTLKFFIQLGRANI